MRDPPFDCPPPNFETHDGSDGWLTMARAIYLPKGKEKIDEAARWKKKEEEWRKLPFLVP